MTDSVIILGAKGRFGRAATQAFVAAGWRTTATARSWESATKPTGAACTALDAHDSDALVDACAGFDVIVNAVNPPYHRWARDVPPATRNIICAANAAGATVMIPGNVYNYGADMPAHLQEDTPHKPTGPLGHLREGMEWAFKQSGVRTIVLRAGDFIEGVKTGNWFDSHIANKVHKGALTYPGPMNTVHAWAYLPDTARALVMLAEKRAAFSAFEEFGFEGYSLTGANMVAAIEAALGRKMKVKDISWRVIRMMTFFMPTLRGVLEMSYLWRTPHQIDGSKLQKALPAFEPTPLNGALSEALAALRL